jgi:hypothetical protein
VAAAGGSIATEKVEPSCGGVPGAAAETRSEGIQLAKADTPGRKVIVTNVHPVPITHWLLLRLLLLASTTYH